MTDEDLDQVVSAPAPKPVLELTADQIADGWQPIATHPTNGSSFDVLCQEGAVAQNIFYGHPPIDFEQTGDRTLRGSQNVLSSYLNPVGWRKPANDRAE
jgi:hypothetical protein